MTTLNDMMVRKQATNEALAHKAGVCSRTVYRARQGLKVSEFLVDCIWIALMANEFQYKKRGPK